VLALSASFLFASGCSKPPEKAILGTWAVDGDATIGILNTGPSRSERVVEAGMMTHTYTFQENQTVVVNYEYGMTSWTRNGTWSVGNADGNKQYYRLEPASGEEWRDYSVYLRGREIMAPFPGIAEESVILKR
jgi:hypothetical protein